MATYGAPLGMPETMETFKQLAGMLIATFPDLHYTIENEIAEGDKVAHRLTGHGTMKGPLMGIPATGREGTWEEMHIVHLYTFTLASS